MQSGSLGSKLRTRACDACECFLFQWSTQIEWVLVRMGEAEMHCRPLRTARRDGGMQEEFVSRELPPPVRCTYLQPLSTVQWTRSLVSMCCCVTCFSTLKDCVLLTAAMETMHTTCSDIVHSTIRNTRASQTIPNNERARRTMLAGDFGMRLQHANVPSIVSQAQQALGLRQPGPAGAAPASTVLAAAWTHVIPRVGHPPFR